jgi:hypothetical protein
MPGVARRVPGPSGQRDPIAPEAVRGAEQPRVPERLHPASPVFDKNPKLTPMPTPSALIRKSLNRA